MKKIITISVMLVAITLCLAGQAVTPPETIGSTIIEWIKNNWWAALIIIVNEVLPLLPTKAKSIITLLWRILVSIFGNKNVSKGL
jgi:hypothetical protein